MKRFEKSVENEFLTNLLVETYFDIFGSSRENC